ncbi:hypothetical protein BX600DRAFT_199045 [Xylariales sp. PMI_506]|nr:hypothetical protein BX600DRAFT_199045 [Xylariales sp. PMI_506]
MTIPYQCLSSLGESGIICAARGSGIFTFGPNGSLLASWQHPTSRPNSGGDDADVANDIDETGAKIDQAGGATPPAKRRRVDADTVGDAVIPNAASEDIAGDVASGETQSNTQKKKKKPGPRHSLTSTQEKALVIVLKSVPDGNYVVAVTGQDKTLWVFEHNGHGQLSEVSQRVMPKRPCDIAFTADCSTILVADKFGDVYSIPLLLSDAAPAEYGNGKPKVSQRLLPKGANSLTVHSQRNLKALEDQIRQRQNPQAERKEDPSFEHDLLLGHVSMLTSIAAAASGSKQYILTADRDEHIRVSRGIPQSHIIESYCLGHQAFINALCFPRPEVLVSGGGDNELYVWDWEAGLLKGKTELLSHVQAVAPNATKLAISKLYNLGSSIVVAICERVPAAFIFHFTDSGLEYSQTIILGGNPLDIAIVTTPAKLLQMVVGIDVEDTTEDSSPQLLVFQQSEGIWAAVPDFSFEDTGPGLPEMSRDELSKALYTVENLRKTEFDYNGSGDAEASAQDSETGSVAP